ncbi:FAD:protein FMN transferase ApbE [Planctomycetales bacterium 10988]|nr:FAD:protein FMN transferase ApbE [Planctomycetales bacterium 10988]
MRETVFHGAVGGRKRSAALIIFLVLIGVAAMAFPSFYFGMMQGSRSLPFTFSGPIMGTEFNVTIAEIEPGTDLAQLQMGVGKVLQDVVDKMSNYERESEISRFNRSTSLEWQPVSENTALVVREALRIAKRTEGAFDPTVAPLVALWNFGPEANSQSRLPSEQEVTFVKKETGYTNLNARDSPPTLRKDLANIKVDLSGIAKGYGVDQAYEFLQENGAVSFLVEIGGEVRTKGKKANGESWRIGIEQPNDNARSLQRTIMLNDAALATSGDYRNFYERNGKRYSHTIDPRDGHPVEHQLASVTVIDSTTMRADAYATAMMVLGPQEGLTWAEQHDLAVLMLIREGNDSYREESSSAFKEKTSVSSQEDSIP